MSSTAMWTHGTSIVIETSESLFSIVRLGSGTDMQIKPGQKCWTHAAIPTPALLRGKRPKLLRVIVLFKTITAKLRELHLYDGSTLKHAFTNVASGGNLLIQNDFNTHKLPSPLEISFALGVSMRWDHMPATGTPQSQQAFIAAVGADFEIAD
jgi:hypothetical protein